MGRSLLIAFRGSSHPLTSLVYPQKRKLEMMERFLGFQRYMEKKQEQGMNTGSKRWFGLILRDLNLPST